MENTVIRGQPTAGQASENEFAGEPRGNIKRSPASLRFGRGARPKRWIVHADRTARAPIIRSRDREDLVSIG